MAEDGSTQGLGRTFVLALSSPRLVYPQYLKSVPPPGSVVQVSQAGWQTPLHSCTHRMPQPRFESKQSWKPTLHFSVGPVDPPQKSELPLQLQYGGGSSLPPTVFEMSSKLPISNRARSLPRIAIARADTESILATRPATMSSTLA